MDQILSHQQIELIKRFANTAKTADYINCARVIGKGRYDREFSDSLFNRLGYWEGFMFSISAYDLTGSHLGKRLTVKLDTLQMDDEGHYTFTVEDPGTNERYEYRATFYTDSTMGA